MTDPITEVPPAPFRAVDAFEVWLQGRINLCVTGLQDQITQLQIENNELKKQLVERGGEMTGEHFATHMQNWIDHCELGDLITNISQHPDWGDAVAEVYGTTEFNDAVEEALRDVDMEDAIKETIIDKLSFEVRVS